MTSRKTKSAAHKSAPYTVGYGKPPLHTRFREGQSGNPSGRPRRTAGERAKALALREAYRTVTVNEGGKALALPAILRSQIVLATKGNVQAQRAVLAAIQEIEQESAEEAARAAQAAPKGPFNDIEAARRVSLLLHLADKEEQEQKLKSDEEEKLMSKEMGTVRAEPPGPHDAASSR
jgi:hypothetical protein